MKWFCCNSKEFIVNCKQDLIYIYKQKNSVHISQELLLEAFLAAGSHQI